MKINELLTNNWNRISDYLQNPTPELLRIIINENHRIRLMIEHAAISDAACSLISNDFNQDIEGLINENCKNIHE